MGRKPTKKPTAGSSGSSSDSDSDSGSSGNSFRSFRGNRRNSARADMEVIDDNALRSAHDAEFESFEDDEGEVKVVHWEIDPSPMALATVWAVIICMCGVGAMGLYCTKKQTSSENDKFMFSDHD